jgi:serine/threonine protein kinase
MAPEIFTSHSYDPTAVDVWSLAIIYCCMVLHRFPWQIAHHSDGRFRDFSTANSESSATGPKSLLRHLPKESRAVIGGMLELNPARRLRLKRVLRDPWIKGIDVCSQRAGGAVHRSGDHAHTLVSGDPSLGVS